VMQRDRCSPAESKLNRCERCPPGWWAVRCLRLPPPISLNNGRPEGKPRQSKPYVSETGRQIDRIRWPNPGVDIDGVWTGVRMR
jgi:hypothetical protein